MQIVPPSKGADEDELVHRQLRPRRGLARYGPIVSRVSTTRARPRTPDAALGATARAQCRLGSRHRDPNGIPLGRKPTCARTGRQCPAPRTVGQRQVALFLLSRHLAFARGRVSMPRSRFHQQRPFVTDAVMRDALEYPQTGRVQRRARSRRRRRALQTWRPLDDSDAWSRSFRRRTAALRSRACCEKPAWLFADEANSGMRRTRRRSTRACRSVRWRASAMVPSRTAPRRAFHDKRWTLVPEPAGGGARYRLEAA